MGVKATVIVAAIFLIVVTILIVVLVPRLSTPNTTGLSYYCITGSNVVCYTVQRFITVTQTGTTGMTTLLVQSTITSAVATYSTGSSGNVHSVTTVESVSTKILTSVTGFVLQEHYTMGNVPPVTGWMLIQPNGNGYILQARNVTLSVYEGKIVQATGSVTVATFGTCSPVACSSILGVMNVTSIQ